MTFKPPIPKGEFPDTSSLFNRPVDRYAPAFPGIQLKLPGPKCHQCDGSGVDSLADYKGKAFDRIQDENLSLHAAWKMESANARMYKRKLLHDSKLRLSVLISTLVFGLVLGQLSWSFEFAVASFSALLFLGLNLRSSAEWSERIDRIREADLDFGDCAGEVR